jgi:hypothetical protein
MLPPSDYDPITTATAFRCLGSGPRGSFERGKAFSSSTEMEANLEAQFIELMKLRERVRHAELSASPQSKTPTRKPAPVVIAAVA